MKKKPLNDGDIELEADTDFGEPADFAEKLKKLKEELRACQAEKQDYLAGWQRAKADFVNWKQSEEKKRSDLVAHANEHLLLSFLPVIDGFELAMGNREHWESVSPDWRKGVESIYQGFLAVFKAHGCEPFGDVGSPFHPNEHEAVAQVETSDAKQDHTIVEILKRGYRLNGKVVRPASVKVAIFKK